MTYDLSTLLDELKIPDDKAFLIRGLIHIAEMTLNTPANRPAIANRLGLALFHELNQYKIA